MNTQSKDTHIVLLYSFNFVSKDQTTKAIIHAFSPYSKIAPEDITFQVKEGKHSAYVKLPQKAATQICSLPQLKIADSIANKRRYFSDFQIFINKLHEKVTTDQIKNYFQKFGPIDQVQITEGHNQQNDSKAVNRHCYIKFRNQEDVDKCLFHPRHQIPIQGQIKTVRTYKIGENQDTDKRIFVKITPLIQNIDQFQRFINTQFTKFGKLRERIKIQQISSNNSCKAIVTFIKNQSCQQALQKFNLKAFNNYTLQLRPFISKQSTHKIFLKGLKSNVTENDLQRIFEIFGKISEKTIVSSKNATANAIIAFEDQLGFKKSLIDYKEFPQIRELFNSQPMITIHMNSKDRKEMGQFNKKNNFNPKKNVPYPYIMGNNIMNPVNMNIPMGGMNINQPNYGNIKMTMNMNSNMNPNINPNIIPNMNPNMMINNQYQRGNIMGFNASSQMFNNQNNMRMIPSNNINISRSPMTTNNIN